MTFSEVDSLTPTQVEQNILAAQRLETGLIYVFRPYVESLADSVENPLLKNPNPLLFERGWYVGFLEGVHVFQGKPVNNKRDIEEDSGEFFFRVVLIDEFGFELDDNQNPD